MDTSSFSDDSRPVKILAAIVVPAAFILFLWSSYSIRDIPNVVIQTMTEEQKAEALRFIEDYEGVIDAAITQDGMKLNLVIVVERRINETVAKMFGENFVRTVKMVGPDSRPWDDLGTGEYDYLVGVYYVDQQQVALGAKVSGSPRISW